MGGAVVIFKVESPNMCYGLGSCESCEIRLELIPQKPTGLSINIGSSNKPLPQPMVTQMH